MDKILDYFNQLAKKHNIVNAFTDFLEISTLAISNGVSKDNNREKRYLELAKKYNDDEIRIMTYILAELSVLLEKEPNDWLGKIFMELLGGRHQGQFFTPYHITEMIAEISIDHERIKRDGHLLVNEPSVGGGAMIIALSEAMKKHNYNIEKQLLVECGDLDVNSTYMAYIQLSLLGICAKVQHKNSINGEVFSSYKTPLYYLRISNMF